MLAIPADRLSLRTEPQDSILCSVILKTYRYPPKRKSYVFPPPFWIQFSISGFWKNKKPLHLITNDKRIFLFLISQCYVTALKFKVFACLSNFPNPLRVFQNTISAIWLTRFWAKFLVCPVDKNLYILLKIGREVFDLSPNSP